VSDTAQDYLCSLLPCIPHIVLPLLLPCFTTDIQESYDVDLDNEEAHGEYLVGLCSEETVGKKTASCLVICRPNTHPEDVKLLKATVKADGVEIVGPAKSKSYLTNADGWMKILKEKRGDFNATKLVTTLTSIVTKLKRATKTKTTCISVKELDLSLSNEYFSPGAAEGMLQMLPIPYNCERIIGSSKDVKVTEVMCIWRAYIVGSEQDVEEDGGDAASEYDMLLELMAKSKV
jgi:hypothetical protein